MPYYEGTAISTTDGEVPPAAIDSLATLHAYYAARLDELIGLPRFDIAAFRGMLGWVVERLAEAESRQPDERLAAVRRSVRTAYEDPAVQAAFERLPATLIHGDVHGGNILQLVGGGSMLIDWGNARLAPAMFDLANMVELGSPNWRRYLAAWEAAAGQAPDEDLARLGYHLATVMVNTQYLPFVVHDWPANTQAPDQASGMTERLEKALRAMKD
jgi:Ser/Thr protein kinase RdoA (MazF antagonist)